MAAPDATVARYSGSEAGAAAAAGAVSAARQRRRPGSGWFLASGATLLASAAGGLWCAFPALGLTSLGALGCLSHSGRFLDVVSGSGVVLGVLFGINGAFQRCGIGGSARCGR